MKMNFEVPNKCGQKELKKSAFQNQNRKMKKQL